VFSFAVWVADIQLRGSPVHRGRLRQPVSRGWGPAVHGLRGRRIRQRGLNSPAVLAYSLDVGDEVEIPLIGLRLACERCFRLSWLFNPIRLFPAVSNPPRDV